MHLVNIKIFRNENTGEKKGICFKKIYIFFFSVFALVKIREHLEDVHKTSKINTTTNF